MKIGILTLYNADYGSYFQAVSLYRYLEEQGHECWFLNIGSREKYVLKNIAAGFVADYVPFVAKLIRKRIAPYNTFCTLRSELSEYRVTPLSLSMKKTSRSFDCVVLGADELWSVSNPYVRYIPVYCGHHIACPHISYATSGIRVGTPVPSVWEEIVTNLRTFESISVRDLPTQEWVGKIRPVYEHVVLDPTLLNPFFRIPDEKIEPYIAVYGEHFSKEQIDDICAYAKKNEYAVRAVSWNHAWADEYVQVGSGMELQRVFAAASYCMVSTFHGTAFSIVQHKPFTAFDTEARGEKMKLLLSQFGLEKRLYSGFIAEEHIDYDMGEEQLAEQRKISEEYLSGALNKIKKIEGE